MCVVNNRDSAKRGTNGAERTQHMNATLKNIHWADKPDWEYAGSDGTALSNDTFGMLLILQGAGTPVTVTGVDCEVDGEFEHDYHGVVLPDGTALEAVSGYNLQPIEA